MRQLTILISLLLCHFVWQVAGQTASRLRITANYKEKRLATVLAGLSSGYGLHFSYSNNLIPLDKKVTLIVTDQTIQETMEVLLKGTAIEYQIIGDQVVLTRKSLDTKSKKPVRPPGTQKPDTATSLPRTGSSLLPEPSLMAMRKIDSISFPELKEAYESQREMLSRNYLAQMDVALETGNETMVQALAAQFRELKINLKKEFNALASKASEVNSGFRKGRTTSTKDTSQNQVTLVEKGMSAKSESAVQVSFIPPLSTNGAENRNFINNLSFNVLGGYSGGLNGFELGGIANVEKGPVKGAQIAGVANLVKGNVRGFQGAGIINTATGSQQGVQVAGTLNLSLSDSSRLFQGAGFGNVHRGDNLGGQVAGFMNLNGGYLVGPQVAGFLNIAKGPVAGAQVAGFMNIDHGNLKGSQTAGCINIARNVYGSQVAGLVNIASKVKGVQIGFLNIADTASGPQIGLLSISRNGYRRLEVFGAERIQTNLAFRMGHKKFHNIFTAGINPLANTWEWSYGYGFGSQMDIGKKGVLHIDLVCNQIMQDQGKWPDELNLLNQLKILPGIRPGQRTAFFAGPVLNVAVSQVRNKENGEIGTGIIPAWTLFDKTDGPTRVAVWVGFNAGIRF